MATRIYKDHKCKNNDCDKIAAKDSKYCSNECNPRKKTRTCENSVCNNPQPKNKWGNYTAYCCDECATIGAQMKYKSTYANKSEEEKLAIVSARKFTVMEKFGVDNVSKSADVKAQLKITTKATAGARLTSTKKNNLEKYGVESTNSLQSVKDLKKSNYKEKTGFDHQLKIPEVAARVSAANTANAPERLAKAAITKEQIYGDKNYNNRVKYKQTCLELFGVENPSQNAEIHAKKMKSEFRRRKFIFPSGKMANVMGYEPQALKELLKTYNEADIIINTVDIPVISYVEFSKNHVYFPDIYIPKDNLIIEVKSQYTYNGFSGWYNTNKLKEQATKDMGYNFKFMIMAKK
jgi:hypothetical protein